MSNIKGLSNTKTYLNKEGIRLGKEFQKEIIRRSRALAVTLQNDINDSVDRGAVNFTKRAILFKYSKGKTSVSTSIIVKDIQAKYLYDIIVKAKSISKIIPTSNARLTAQGNISGLRNNLRKGKFKVVDKKLIDTSKKKKRVIGVMRDKKRKLIMDFYANAEKGAALMISDIKGTFRVRKDQ